MNRPEIMIAGKRVCTQWTELRFGANDTLRCIALIGKTNDNSWSDLPPRGAA